jgi:hypothetical protein
VRADYVLLRLNLSADIFQLEGELRWAKQARETVSWLLAEDVVWPAARGRTEATSDLELERRGARAELFGRMSDSDLRAAPDPQDRGSDDRQDPGISR